MLGQTSQLSQTGLHSKQREQEPILGLHEELWVTSSLSWFAFFNAVLDIWLNGMLSFMQGAQKREDQFYYIC